MMPIVQCRKVLTLLLTATLVACGSDSPEQPQGSDTDNALDSQNTLDNNTIAAQPDLLGMEWTLETVRDSDGEYRPLPLESTWSLTFNINGDVHGLALCNQGSGSWQADDSTLSIVDWAEDGAFCESTARIPTATQTIVGRLYGGETVMPRIESNRLFVDTGDGAQLVFSGRATSEGEQTVSFETLVRAAGFSRAGNGDPVFGNLPTPYVIYRDSDSLEADYARLPAEGTPSPALPSINFTSSLVVGAYLPLDGQVSSDVVVRGARTTPNGLEIDVARFGPSVPDEVSVNCAADDALTAPWTLVRIDSVVEPIDFSEMARAFCSGVPVDDDF